MTHGQTRGLLEESLPMRSHRESLEIRGDIISKPSDVCISVATIRGTGPLADGAQCRRQAAQIVLGAAARSP
jgi:hypothetical protein